MNDTTGCGATQHGTANAYRNHKCRCPNAAAANTRYGKLRAAGLHQPAWVDSVGVRRRRQALAAIGYGLPELAPYFGTSCGAVASHAHRQRVHRATLQRWREVYDLLSMIPGPNGKARQEAARRGWPPPLAWDDDAIDDPKGKPAPNRRRHGGRAVIAEEARHLLRFGVSRAEAAQRLGVSESWINQLLGGGKRAAA